MENIHYCLSSIVVNAPSISNAKREVGKHTFDPICNRRTAYEILIGFSLRFDAGMFLPPFGFSLKFCDNHGGSLFR